MWSVAVFFCVISFLICRWRRTGGIILLPIAGLWSWAMLAEIHDPHVGPAIVRELGRGYVVQVYFASLIPFACLGIAFF
jgi:hypothetical protein